MLYEVEVDKAHIEHKGTTIVGFLPLRYAKLRMLQHYNSFAPKFFDII